MGKEEIVDKTTRSKVRSLAAGKDEPKLGEFLSLLSDEQIREIKRLQRAWISDGSLQRPAAELLERALSTRLKIKRVTADIMAGAGIGPTVATPPSAPRPEAVPVPPAPRGPQVEPRAPQAIPVVPPSPESCAAPVRVKAANVLSGASAPVSPVPPAPRNPAPAPRGQCPDMSPRHHTPEGRR